MGRTLLWIVLALAFGAAGWFVFGDAGEEGGGDYVDPELVELPFAHEDQPGLKGTGTNTAASTHAGGAYAIHGRVLDQEGNPVADVPVVARHEGKAHIPNDPASWTRSIDEAIRGVVERVERSPDARRPVRASVRTDAQGHFHLSLAEAARYRVEVTPTAPAVCPYQTVSVYAGEPKAERTFTLVEGAPLHGTVVDENDKPIVATLHPTQTGITDGVYRSWAGTPVTSAAADGTWRFDAVPRGTVRIGVHLADGRRISGISAEVPHTGPFVIRLPGGQAALSGTVTDAAGAAVPDTLVAVTVRWKADDVAGSMVLRARSDAAGAFAFAHVPPGTVGYVEAVAQGFLPYRKQHDAEGSETLELAGGEGAAPTTIAVELQRGGTVTGRLTASDDGAPIAGATIQLHRRQAMGQPMSYAIPPVTTDSDGRYRIEGVAQGSYVAMPEADGYFLPQLVNPTQNMVMPAGANGRAAPPELTVVMTAEGKEVVRDLVLGKGFDVPGVVVDGDGAPVAGAEVHAQGYGIQQVAWQWGIRGRNAEALATSGSDGRFTVRGLPPRDNWILFAKKEGHAGVHASAFALGADSTPAKLELKLQQGGVLRGRLEGLDAGAMSEAQLGFWGPKQELAFKSWGHKPNADGTFEITGVPPGDWTMNVWANGRQAPQKQITGLKAGEVREGIVLTFAEGLEVTGRIVDSQGQPVARLNVMLQVQSGSWNQSVTDSDGNFRFPSVAKGSAQLMTWSESGQQIPIGKRFDVPADGIELVYDKPKTVVLRGEVQAADGSAIAVCNVSVRTSGSSRNRGPIMYDGGQGGRDAINGRFELKTSGDGPWVVSAMNARGEDGKPLNLKRVQTVVRDPSERIVLRMEAGVSVGGRVLDAAGKGIAGVNVTVGRKGARTGKDGRFTVEGLDESQLVVQVNPPAGLVRPKAQTARAGQTDLEFRLIEGKTIAGTALGPDGKPLTQGYASAMWKAQGEHPQGSAGAQVQAEGAFAIKGIPPGVRARVSVQVWSSSGKIAYAPAVVEDVMAGTTDLEIRIGGGLTIQGRVLGHDGKAPGQCYVYGRSEDGKKQTGWVQIGEDGTFELGGLEAVPYTITVNRQDGGAAPPPVTVTPPRSGVEIRLPRSVSFGGRIEGLGTESGERWRIRVWTADGKQIGTGRVNADGTWELASIAELDDVFVAATRSGDDRFARAGPVKTSNKNVVLRLTRGKTITGTVEGAERDGRIWAFVMAQGEDGWRSTGRIAQDGTFTIHGVPEGTYTVKAQQYGANAKSAEVGGVQAGATGVALDLR